MSSAGVSRRPISGRTPSTREIPAGYDGRFAVNRLIAVSKIGGEQPEGHNIGDARRILLERENPRAETRPHCRSRCRNASTARSGRRFPKRQLFGIATGNDCKISLMQQREDGGVVAPVPSPSERMTVRQKQWRLRQTPQHVMQARHIEIVRRPRRTLGNLLCPPRCKRPRLQPLLAAERSSAISNTSTLSFSIGR